MATALLEHSSRASLRRRLTYCADCGRLSYENEDVCRCGGNEKPDPVSHLGEIYSYTTVQHSAGPFVLALIRLSGGQLVTGRIESDDRELKVGLPVELIADARSSPGPEARGLSFCPLGAKAVIRR